MDIARVHAKPLVEHRASIQDRLKTARHALSLHTSKLRALEVRYSKGCLLAEVVSNAWSRPYSMLGHACMGLDG
jgi:hypothetical protein